MVKTLIVVSLFLWPSAAANLRSASLPAAQGAASSPIEGVWIYAKDPKGVAKSEAIYEGSTITFGAGGKYSFQLGETSIALQGSWELRGTKGDVIRVHTEYGQGRSNDLALTVRRDAGGKVVGLEVREGDGSTGARYYVPRAK